MLDYGFHMVFIMNMTERQPYHFNPEELHADVRKHLLQTETFRFRDQEYTFGIIARDAAPTLPHFVGMPGGQNLIGSEDLLHDPDLLAVSLGHEVLCNRLYADQPGHCARAEQEILQGIKSPEVYGRILVARKALFDGLLMMYKVNRTEPATDFHRELLGTERFLTSEKHRYTCGNP